MLPDWADPETLRWMLLVALALVVYAMWVVVRTVQRVALKVVLFAALAGVGLSLWVQRTDLQNCARTCECRLYGQDVEIPPEKLPPGQCGQFPTAHAG